MINPKDWLPEEVKIFKDFGYKCLHCKSKDAVTLHEIVPKSVRPKTWCDPTNRVPLCNACHEQIHAAGARKSKRILMLLREDFLSGYG
jgi:5-methylcytosine-specific restriction endonuclease McrA